MSDEKTRNKPDALNSEFLYYSSVLRIVGPALSSARDREEIIPWIKKLFGPEYHGAQFKEKRNRYLLYVTLTLVSDEIGGMFSMPVPEGALPELEDLEKEVYPAAEWEKDKMWQETLEGLPDDYKALECSVHEDRAECIEDHALDDILDQEFQFMIYLARPYATLISNSDDRTKIALWLQMLCSICGDSCSSMRGIRNDYMMALLSYIHDLRVVGPFTEYPSWKTLIPLAEAAKKSAGSKPLTDPSNPEANEFLAGQPIPTDGAFCYVALTGDLVSVNFAPA